MKSNVLIGIMLIVWLLLMASIIWQSTDGKWQVEDVEKIAQLEVAKYTDQMIVVAVSDEGDAKLCFYEKENDWKLVLETEAFIGKNGLGKTKEGDGKTPIGVFSFIEAFGIMKNPGTKMKYTRVDESHYWVDDSGSKYYNQFVSLNEIVKDWESAEHIVAYGESYHYVLATSYNVERIPGKGSAVFLHCTSEETEATAGCIAVPEVYMKKITNRIEPEGVLVIDYIDKILEY